MVHRLRVLVSAVMAVVTAGLISSPALADDAGTTVGGAATCPLHGPGSGNRVRPALAPTRTYRGSGDTTVYLERHGGVLRPGYDDSAAGESALVYGAGLRSLTVPAFGGSDRAWKQVVTCVQDGLAAYAIDVVDERPASGDYIMMMVGGKASMLGYGGGVSGVAPYNGGLMRGAVGFVFAAAVRNDADQVCQSALHEIGHTLGLDHAYECRDVMSYLHGCGDKSFTDIDATCGEYGERECGDGADTQNSHRRLVANLGLRAAPEPEPVPEPIPEPEPVPEPEPIPEPTLDPDLDWGGWGEHEPAVAAPTVELMGVEIERGTDSRTVYVAAWVTGGSRVELAWAMEEQAYLFDCDRLPADAPVTCEREGSLVLFTLLVGKGQRMFAVRATNAAGEAMTEPRRLETRARRRGSRR